MALERRSASQVVTFTPQQALWSFPVVTAGWWGQSPGWAQPYAGLPFIVVGTFTAGSPIAPGDRFQLWTGASLKEPTVFTVSGLTPSAGFSAWNVFFTPNPASIPTNADTAVSLAAPKDPRWLGSLGHVNSLKYSWTCPGGDADMSCVLQLPPTQRPAALDPGRVVQVWRAGSCAWEGKLNEATPSTDGWVVTAHGAGTCGGDFQAYYQSWTPDDPVNRAIARGLRWDNPGIGSPAGIYLGQQQDSGSLSITAFMNLLCSGGGLLWQVTPSAATGIPAPSRTLSVFPLKSDAYGVPTGPPDLMLVSTTPVPRTVLLDVNNILLRYQVSADIPATSTAAAVPATYATVFAGNTASTSKHGPIEYYLDLSSAGVMTAAAARVIGQNVLQKYVRATFAGTFEIGPGQLLNAGGAPVDPGFGVAGKMIKPLITDAPYGGELAAAPMVFMAGTHEFDNDTNTAKITPYGGVRLNLSGLVAALYPAGQF